MKKSLFFLSALTLVFSCTEKTDVEFDLEPSATISSVNASQESTVRKGLVKFDDELVVLAEQSPEQVAKMLGGISIERLFPDAGEFEARSRKEGLHRWYKVKYNSASAMTKAAVRMDEIAGVDVFEEEIPTVLAGIPFNDPYASQQWHYFNDGTSGRKKGADINVVPVWNNYTTGRSDVIVAVVDAGVDFTHPDLEGVVIQKDSRSFFSGYDFRPGEHGTHVGGTIAAINNNGLGVCGIAGGDAANGISGAKLISLQTFVDTEEGTIGGGDSSAAIKWAADHGAVICSNSWSYSYKTLEDAKNGNIAQSLRDAIDYFNKYAGMAADGVTQVGPMAGGLVLFAAGNEGWQYGWPSAYEGVMAVGAFDGIGGRAYYSNYGDWVDISAPGGSYQNDKMVLSTLPRGQYGSMQGTSMACPHVSGVAALVVSQFGGPGFTREMLWERLVKGSSNVVPTALNIGPAVDALGAITYGNAVVPDVPKSVSVSAKSNTMNLSIPSYADPSGVPIFGFLAVYGTNRSDVESATPSKLGKAKSKAFENDAAIGSVLKASIEDLEFNTTYYVKVYGYTYSLVYSTPSDIYSVAISKNNPPVITKDVDELITLRPFDSAKINVSVSDPDGHAFTIEYKPGSEADSFVTTSNGGVISINPSLVDEGSYTAKIIAKDKYGATSESIVDYVVLPNTPPEVIRPIANQIVGSVGSNIKIDLASYFTDADGETLRYSVSSTSEGVIHAAYEGGMLVLYALSEGYADITVTAKDAKGDAASCIFKSVCCDPGVAVTLYPNPASKILNIRTYDEGEYNVEIISQNGATVYSAKKKISVFEPLLVDVSGFAAGVYTATVKSSSVDYKTTFVKR